MSMRPMRSDTKRDPGSDRASQRQRAPTTARRVHPRHRLNVRLKRLPMHRLPTRNERILQSLEKTQRTLFLRPTPHLRNLRQLLHHQTQQQTTVLQPRMRHLRNIRPFTNLHQMPIHLHSSRRPLLSRSAAVPQLPCKHHRLRSPMPNLRDPLVGATQPTLLQQRMSDAP